MPLISLWNSNPTAVAEFTIEQIVATAGDGILRNGSICSEELLLYLAQIQSSKLATYVSQCLSKKLEKGGMILQDLINELGRRLDYNVKNGLYQGIVNAIGYDGIWLSPEGGAIIVEVKTTDAYRISLDTIANYRERLISARAISGTPSILIVVGRQDTGEVEAQIRGSRHAWDIRLISAEALINLVRLKENSDDPETGRKIRSILTPLEYTRLDRLVDVMFTAVTDAAPIISLRDGDDDEEAIPNSAIAIPSEADHVVPMSRNSVAAWEFTDPKLLERKRDGIIKAMSTKMGTPLVTKSRALFWSSDHAKRIACTISKRYTKRQAYPYWYAFHPAWDEFLGESEEGYLVLGCMDLSMAFALPYPVVRECLSALNVTQTERGKYWHMHIVKIADVYELLWPKRSTNLDISKFVVELMQPNTLT